MLRVIPLLDNFDTALVAKKFIAHVYCKNGLSNKILLYLDSIFMSGFWKTLFKALQVKISPSTAYHP